MTLFGSRSVRPLTISVRVDYPCRRSNADFVLFIYLFIYLFVCLFVCLFEVQEVPEGQEEVQEEEVPFFRPTNDKFPNFLYELAY